MYAQVLKERRSRLSTHRSWLHRARRTQEVEEVLASMPNSGSALETCDVMRPGLASTTRGMRVLSHHTARVAALALSPALLASGDMSGNVVIWDRPSWAPLASMPFRRPVEHLCFVAPRDIIAVSEASMSQICIQEHGGAPNEIASMHCPERCPRPCPCARVHLS